MTTEDDFQRALDAEPGASHTRAVFADWLEEHSDPRAAGYRILGDQHLYPFKAKKHWLYFGNPVDSYVDDYYHCFLPYRLVSAAERSGMVCCEVSLNNYTRWTPIAFNSRRHADDVIALTYAHMLNAVKLGYVAIHQLELLNERYCYLMDSHFTQLLEYF